ncbi:membrane protein [Betaproteobacteria bacterium]|nr:membrane protein [Betaproteobacteria bacterium]GHU00084.1 membrane protein [Betaproteobacteria bacterium]GHU21268.1 membrane protein [Betaproteobacteria bacterium]
MASHSHSHSSRPAPHANGNVLLIVAFCISLVAHATVLAVQFVGPRSRSPHVSTLEVVLVNARTTTRPDKPKVEAQYDYDGGGTVDKDVRATSPLPPQEHANDGDALVEARRRQQPAVQQQPQQPALTAPGSKVAIAQRQQPPEQTTEAQAQTSGVDVYDQTAASVKNASEIDRKIQEYNQRPRKLFVGPQAASKSTAMYTEAWRQKIERIGEINYPEAARGKIYGNLQLQVTLDAEGNVKDADILRSSGHKVLDEAAINIVKLGAPYARFPPDIRRDYDQIVIVRTWTFTNRNQIITR